MKQLIYIFMLIIMLSSVVAIGVAPSRKTVEYSPNDIAGSLRILNDEHQDMSVAVYARGNLADYVFFEEEIISFAKEEYEKPVSYTLELPRKLPPGQNIIEVFVVQVDNNNPNTNIVQTNLGLIHKIIIEVPYPGKYLQGILFVSEAKPQQTVQFTAGLSSLGEEQLEDITGSLIIKDTTGKPVAQLATNSIDLAPNEKGKLEVNWFADVDPGTYRAEMVIKYGSELLLLEKTFDVGSPLVEIKNIQVADFTLGNIARFDIVLESKWNNDIKEVATSTTIYDQDANTLDQFDAQDVALDALSSRSVASYWDTQGVLPDTYTLNVRLGYLGRTKENRYDIALSNAGIEFLDAPFTGNVVSENENPTISLLPLLIGAGIILGLVAVLFMVKRKPKTSTSLYASPMQPTQPVQKPINSQNPQAFIRYHLDQGFTPKSIKKKLMQLGYTEEQAEDLILSLE